MKIAVVSNCQTYGLINCMSLLAPGSEVSGMPMNRIDDKFDFGDFDVIFCAPPFETELRDRAPNAKIKKIPFVFFDRYHPDLTYLKCGDVTVLGPCDAYHSLIVFGGYMAGKSHKEIREFFNGEVFSSLGYLSGWNAARDRFLSEFIDSGIRIEEDFTNWTRRGCFMHTINHPQIRCLFSIAKRALDAAEINRLDIRECLVADNLATATIFPVYPDVASARGAVGGYLFKAHFAYKMMGLDQFITESYAAYDGYDKESLRVTNSTAPIYKKFLEIVA